MMLFHGGFFVGNEKNQGYVDGKAAWFDFCDVNWLFVAAVKKEAKQMKKLEQAEKKAQEAAEKKPAQEERKAQAALKRAQEAEVKKIALAEKRAQEAEMKKIALAEKRAKVDQARNIAAKEKRIAAELKKSQANYRNGITQEGLNISFQANCCTAIGTRVHVSSASAQIRRKT